MNYYNKEQLPNGRNFWNHDSERKMTLNIKATFQDFVKVYIMDFPNFSKYLDGDKL